ncbi:hypothetical protein GF354_00920 [Candidatus Peregrinibacteria bacterium]|nr:hypothetical protein [Candidatus Peregrinibacteria bacterium]
MANIKNKPGILQETNEEPQNVENVEADIPSDREIKEILEELQSRRYYFLSKDEASALKTLEQYKDFVAQITYNNEFQLEETSLETGTTIIICTPDSVKEIIHYKLLSKITSDTEKN